MLDDDIASIYSIAEPGGCEIKIDFTSPSIIHHSPLQSTQESQEIQEIQEYFVENKNFNVESLLKFNLNLQGKNEKN